MGLCARAQQSFYYRRRLFRSIVDLGRYFGSRIHSLRNRSCRQSFTVGSLRPLVRRQQKADARYPHDSAQPGVHRFDRAPSNPLMEGPCGLAATF